MVMELRESGARGWTRREVGFTQFLTHKYPPPRGGTIPIPKNRDYGSLGHYSGIGTGI